VADFKKSKLPGKMQVLTDSWLTGANYNPGDSNSQKEIN
jgi:hypothetical protein